MSGYQYRSKSGRLYRARCATDPDTTTSNDWNWAADDYDGAPDSGDTRCGTAGSYWACVDQIEESENDAR